MISGVATIPRCAAPPPTREAIDIGGKGRGPLIFFSSPINCEVSMIMALAHASGME